MRDARLHPERAAVQRDSFHVKCCQLSSKGAALHGSDSCLPLDTIPAMHSLYLRRLATDVPLLWFLPEFVPIPIHVLRCLQAVNPALGAT